MGKNINGCSLVWNKFHRWPVPMPYWCHPDCVEDESEDDEELGFPPTFGCKLKYNYINGEKSVFY
uniref:Uncharacterized protein n=1 Tax=Leersia perrieri TaxID=77586 RepID=A0A0D9V9R5_9ORYZ